MARVKSVGGIATVLRGPQGAFEPESETVINVNVRLYAKTDMGLLAIDDRPQSYSAGIPREAFERGEPHAVTGLISAPELLRPDLGEGRTQGPWTGVVGELKRIFDIDTDPETLQALPFELIGDRELVEALNR